MKARLIKSWTSLAIATNSQCTVKSTTQDTYTNLQQDRTDPVKNGEPAFAGEQTGKDQFAEQKKNINKKGHPGGIPKARKKSMAILKMIIIPVLAEIKMTSRSTIRKCKLGQNNK